MLEAGKRGDGMAGRYETRRGRRVAVQLSANLVCGNETIATQTENVSFLGTYVHHAKEVPVGTPTRITLLLPQHTGGGTVECQGVIVRCENLQPGTFGLGIFFNEFLGDGEERLGILIDNLLKQQTLEAERYFEERDRIKKERMKKKLAEKRRKRKKRGRPRKKKTPPKKKRS